jgi:Zn-dependent alcohol dehydrogenase
VGLDELIALDVDDTRLELAVQMGATECHNTAPLGFE